MTAFETVTLEVPDAEAATAFYEAFGLSSYVQVRTTRAPANGFRGFALSLVAAQPGDVDALTAAAVSAGATTTQPATKSFWGYGGVVRTPDGTLCKIASSKKKDVAPVTGRIDQVALLLGVADVKASKQFYVGKGLAVGKSYGGKYVEFDTPSSAVTLALYPRRALAKDVGTADDGSGSHGIVFGGQAGTFTDPDGFEWEN
ncbi:glyoxalase [Kribbella sandramycini]|uniref:Glyoxalase n=1 Tax=Kribbella sandramycini TaxID=60450 RepID=A0A7Y4KZV5_9ACTN|nr:glyoxalase [Kribbella sandramycini]MBB6565441.1 putative lactoylglutathione lyase [Kribbella sandramycini]NOL41709.1 glyoxalase [Kribbella sandramycini]